MLTRIFLGACLSAITITACAQHNSEEVLVDSKSLSADQIRYVDAETEGGNISVEGVNNADTRVEVYARSKGNDESIKQLYAEYYDVKINTGNGTLTVLAKRKKRMQRDPQLSVSFRIYVPVSATNKLNTSGGNIHCRNLSGSSLKIKTSGGNIALEDVKGNVSGKTSGGNINISNCSDTLDLFTSGGNIHAGKSKGRLNLSTSGGNISLEELTGNIEAETSGGNVSADDVSGKLTTSSSGGNLNLRDMSCSLDASTSGGNLDIIMRKTGEYVKLRNRGSGHTQVQLPEGVGMNIEATGRSVKVDHSKGLNGDVREHKVSGSVNGGGIPVSIDGGDSKVVVTFRQ